LSPETLWSLGKVSGLGISKDKQQVLFSVNFPDVEANKGNETVEIIPEMVLTGY
jgi:hypothetical protein